MSGDVLKRALSLLSLADVWGLAPVSRPTPLKGGAVLSPFRDERHASFSLSKDLRVFYDHADPGRFSGGVWEFVRLCRPDWSKRELADFFIESAGLAELDAAEKATRQAGEARPRDPDAERKAWLKRRKREESEAQARSGACFEEGLRLPDAGVNPGRWPSFVEERWGEGMGAASASIRFFSRLRLQRGWPEAWIEALIDWGKLSWPLLPWREDRRGRAFLVEAPAWTQDGAEGVVEPVGFHQVWWRPMPAGSAEAGERCWLFAPWAVADKAGRPRGCFMDLLAKAGRSVPPLPFVLGEPSARIRTVVVTEGQWDAVSFWGACGWFDPACWPEDVLVLGLRGARGADCFLSFYGNWLSMLRPAVLLLHDADAAGRSWVERPVRAAGLPPEACFADRLKAAGCGPVVRSCPKIGEAAKPCKDFNDVWRFCEPKPNPAAVLAWLAGLGVMGGEG